MDNLFIKEHNGKEIIYLDLSNFNISRKDTLRKHVDEAKDLIAKSSPKSALVLTDVTKTGFDMEISSIFKDYASHNTPYVKASALVGISGLQKVILTAVKKLTGRDFYLAATPEEALDWLVAQ